MRRPGAHELRVTFLFLTGLIVIGHEVFFFTGERPFVLAAAMAMMGFPVLLGADSWARKNGTAGNGKESGP